MGLVKGVDRWRQGGDDKGEADSWSIVSGEETEAYDVAEKKVNKKVMNTFVILKH